jgi:hypothetical protein
MSKPKFERRHYVAISELLRNHKPMDPTEPNILTHSMCRRWDDMVWSFACLFERDNPAFKQSNFILACGAQLEVDTERTRKQAAE